MPYPYYPYNPYMQYQPQQQASFIRVQNEMQAREWNVAPGNSMTFIDDNAPYCYTKSMGMSQFDSPVFKRFRLVEEEPAQSIQNNAGTASNDSQVNLSEYMTKAEFEPFKVLLERIEKEFYNESAEQSTES